MDHIYEIIQKYYRKDSELYNLLVAHSTDVMQKALQVAELHPELQLDVQFLKEAAMLHDIGIFVVDAPKIHCYGVMPYVCHGYLGREILDRHDMPLHGLVCERHTGVGLYAADIEGKSLPLPVRDMSPVSMEEQVICYADCFFSKTKLGVEKTVAEARAEIEKYNTELGLIRFDTWCEVFG